jgi:hypothetical protein
VANVQDHDFVPFHGIKNEIPESPNVYSANTRLFRFLGRIGLLAELYKRPFDGIYKISSSKGSEFEKV